MYTAEQIYLQYHDKVRAYVRGKIQDPHDVEDLVSVVFMKIVQKLDSPYTRYCKSVILGYTRLRDMQENSSLLAGTQQKYENKCTYNYVAQKRRRSHSVSDRSLLRSDCCFMG